MAIAPTITVYLQMDMVGTIARAFFIAAAMFAALSAYGYMTKRNLGPIASFAMMGVFGMIILMLLNIFFFQDSGLQLLISVAVVGLFAVLTAWQTQSIKEMYYASDNNDDIARYAIFGASQLMGSFIILFIYILQILGALRGE